MTYRYIILLLFPLVIRCQNVSSWGKLRLNDMVIPPYRSGFTSFNNDIVAKLINVDLVRSDRVLSPLAHELYCTVQGLHFNFKQASLANEDLIRQIDIHIDQLVDAISRKENEVRQTETVMNELNTTVENAREQVRLAQKVLNEKHKHFSELIKYEVNKSIAACEHTQGTVSHRWISQWQDIIEHPLVNRLKRSLLEYNYAGSRMGGFGCSRERMSPTYHIHALKNSPSYIPIRTGFIAATTSLKERRDQLEGEIKKYRSSQSQFMKCAQQLAQQNLVLQHQRTAGTVATTLNTHFKLIQDRLKMVSDPSKRLLDILKNLLDFKAITEPLLFIYEKLVSEQMIEPLLLEISFRTIDKINHKLTLLAAKLPQLRYRQKQFHQFCTYTVPKPMSPHMDLKLNETTWSQLKNEAVTIRSRRGVTTCRTTCVASPYGDGCLVPAYSDEFHTFDSSKWAHTVTMSGGGNWEFEMYVPDSSNSFVQNSALHIHPSCTADWFQQTMCTNYSSPPVDWQNGCELSFDAQPTKTIYGTTTPYPGVYPGQCNDASDYGCERTASSGNILNPIRSARIMSTFSFTYGRVEVRAKLPVGNWLWPAIWMLPESSVYGTWPLSGEIDIMESRGNAPGYQGGGNNHFGSTLHWGTMWNTDQWSYTTQGYTDSRNTLTSEWHVYGLKWTSTGLYTYIDNDCNRVLTVNMSLPLWQEYQLSGSNPWAGDGTNAPFNQPFYIIFNTAVGGTNGYFPTNDWPSGGATTFWNNRANWQSTWTQPDLMIDYIRVYQ